MPTFRSGDGHRHPRASGAGLQRVEVDGEKAYVLTELVGPVAVGDPVVMNTTAVDLGLGTGGWHVVHWNLSRDDVVAAVSGTRDEGALHERADRGGRRRPAARSPPSPSCCASLHSQLAAVALAYKRDSTGRPPRVRDDRRRRAAAGAQRSGRCVDGPGAIDGTVTAGHAFGGDREAITIEHALAVAGDLEPDAIVVGIGPGSLGVGDAQAFSGLDGVRALDIASHPIVAAALLRGRPAPTRHKGVSHHSATVLDAVARPVTVPIPAGEPRPAGAGAHDVVEVDVPDLIAGTDGHRRTSMGRRPAEDPKFWAYAGAAGVAAAPPHPMTDTTISAPEPTRTPTPRPRKRRRQEEALPAEHRMGGDRRASRSCLRCSSRRILIEAFYIPSGSMETTLETGDRVLVNKLSYRLHDVHRGDVVVFERPPERGGGAAHQATSSSG